LVVDPDYCTPEELRKSDLLFEVADVELPATSKEMAFWESRTDVPRLMADATNAVLKATRRKSPEIQSLNDINDYLLSHPEDDHYFRKAYERSGYLSIWQVEYEKSRWQYDLDRMTRIADAVPDSRAEIESYCKETVAGAADGRRYDINHQGYLDLDISPNCIVCELRPHVVGYRGQTEARFRRRPRHCSDCPTANAFPKRRQDLRK
jgi:hypothetical protein